jgi:DNA-binding IclR family transcriptional regulator
MQAVSAYQLLCDCDNLKGIQIMNTAERLVTILDALASAGGPCGVSELSRQLKLGRCAIFRLLSALEDQGWVAQNTETEKYSLTGAIAEVAFRALSQLDIQKISGPCLQELQQATGETSALCIRVELERMFISSVPSNHALRHLVNVGIRLKMWYGWGGKSILAFMTDDEIEAVLSQFNNSGDSVLASGQIVTVESLREELSEIRKQGFVVSAGARTSELLGVSAPIFDHRQQVVGSIGVSGPTPRFDMGKAIQYSTLIMEKAKKISMTLGAKLE